MKIKPEKLTPAVSKDDSNQSFFGKNKEAFFGTDHAEASDSFFSSDHATWSKGNPVQAKLTVGQAKDNYEQEADAAADKAVQCMSGSQTGSALQLKCDACEQEEKLQKKSLPGVNSALPAKIESKLNASRHGGSPVPPGVRKKMEQSFNADFSGVRIHTGSDAVQMNDDLNAQAFTQGNDIYFNTGKFDTDSHAGKHLLAHELAHTVQQNTSMVQCALAAVDIDAIAEEVHEAVEGWGTDEERIFVNLQRLKKDPVDIASLKTSYSTKFGTGLEAELRDEMSGSELRLALELIGINDAAGAMVKAAAPANPADFTAEATKLQSAMEGWGTDEEAIYAVLLPLNRDVAKLNQLKAAYKTLTGNELQSDIEDEMSSDELHYALYLLNGLPDEPAVVTGATENAPGTVVTTGTVPGGTTTASTGVDYNLGATNYPKGFSFGYKGGIAADSRWLQFIWREMIVTKTDGTEVRLNDAITNAFNFTYNLTTDPGNPNYNTDTGRADNPFYESDATGVIRTADADSIYDMPGSAMNFVTREFGLAVNPATKIISRAHFNTFLIRDYRPIYQVGLTVEWTFNSAVEPPRVQSLDTSKKVDSLPEAMRNRLIAQFPTFNYIQ